jgi:hypothetical protein
MSEAHLKVFINDLSYMASLPIKTTMSTISYYTNLSEELETGKALISSLKTELKLKDDIISMQDIRLETERNLYFVQRSEIEEKDEIISTLIKNDIAKNEVVMMSLMKLSQQNEYLNEELEKERSLTASLKKELEQSKNTNRCSNCFINNITINVPCPGHSYCISCMIEKNNCIVCKSYLMFHKKI